MKYLFLALSSIFFTAAISQQEVGQHSSPNNCWMSIQNGVYDVTRFLNAHPGGASVMLPYCGKDATGPFNMFHNPRVLAQYGQLKIGQVGASPSTAASSPALSAATQQFGISQPQQLLQQPQQLLQQPQQQPQQLTFAQLVQQQLQQGVVPQPFQPFQQGLDTSMGMQQTFQPQQQGLDTSMGMQHGSEHGAEPDSDEGKMMGMPYQPFQQPYQPSSLFYGASAYSNGEPDSHEEGASVEAMGATGMGASAQGAMAQSQTRQAQQFLQQQPFQQFFPRLSQTGGVSAYSPYQQQPIADTKAQFSQQFPQYSPFTKPQAQMQAQTQQYSPYGSVSSLFNRGSPYNAQPFGASQPVFSGFGGYSSFMSPFFRQGM